jgi:hypothetical protein
MKVTVHLMDGTDAEFPTAYAVEVQAPLLVVRYYTPERWGPFYWRRRKGFEPFRLDEVRWYTTEGVRDGRAHHT